MSVGASSGDKERGQSLIESWWRVVAQWYWWALKRRPSGSSDILSFAIAILAISFFVANFATCRCWSSGSSFLQICRRRPFFGKFCQFIVTGLLSTTIRRHNILSLSDGVVAAVASLVYTHIHIVIRGLSSVFVCVFVFVFFLSLSLSDWVLAQQWCRRPSGVLAAA